MFDEYEGQSKRLISLDTCNGVIPDCIYDDYIKRINKAIALLDRSKQAKLYDDCLEASWLKYKQQNNNAVWEDEVNKAIDNLYC